MKKVIAVVLSLLGFLPAVGQTLQPGDVAVVGINMDNPDAFAFVALADIPASTVLYFTDNGWKSDASFRSNEGTGRYVVSSTLSAGTVITLTPDDLTAVGSNKPAFAVSGDQLLVYQGSESNPTFIHAVTASGSGWDSDATSSNTSALPTGLQEGYSAVGLASCDNVKYNGITSGSRTALLSAIGTPGNWLCDDGSRFDLSFSFNVSGGGNNLPTFSEAPSEATVISGQLLTLTYAASDPDGDPITYQVSGPTGIAIDAATGLLQFTPTAAQVGSHTATIGAFDGTNAATTLLEITVLPASVGEAPRFVRARMDTTAQAGSEFRMAIEAVDPQEGPLTYRVVSGFDGATFEGNDLVWTVTLLPGIISGTVEVEDGDGWTARNRIYVAVQGTLREGLQEQSLRSAIATDFKAARSLGYSTARDSLYGTIEKDENQTVHGVYTGFGVQHLAGDARSTMTTGGINAEHIWPQSMGAGNEPQRSDLHILYPAKDNVNSARGNLPYADIPDAQTRDWYLDTQQRTSAPPMQERDLWSERSSSHFEPRESMKGDAARAALYFAMMHPSYANASFLNQQLETLLLWDQLDPPSGREVRRNALIDRAQGNVNPFILDRLLAYRIWKPSAVSRTVTPEVDSTWRVYPNPASTWATIAGRLGPEDQVMLVDLLGRTVLTTAPRATRLELGHLPSGTYFVRVARAEGGISTQVLSIVR